MKLRTNFNLLTAIEAETKVARRRNGNNSPSVRFARFLQIAKIGQMHKRNINISVLVNECSLVTVLAVSSFSHAWRNLEMLLIARRVFLLPEESNPGIRFNRSFHPDWRSPRVIFYKNR